MKREVAPIKNGVANSMNHKRKLEFHTAYHYICMFPYKGILEELDSKPMLKMLRQPEFRWPVVGDGLGGEYQWSESQWSLLKTLAQMRNQHSKSVLIRLYVSPDDKNSSYYIIKVRYSPIIAVKVRVSAQVFNL